MNGLGFPSRVNPGRGTCSALVIGMLQLYQLPVQLSNPCVICAVDEWRPFTSRTYFFNWCHIAMNTGETSRAFITCFMMFYVSKIFDGSKRGASMPLTKAQEADDLKNAIQDISLNSNVRSNHWPI